jgi:ferritin-like metal-binding protein YciE
MAEKDLKALFLHQLKDTYFAENAILKALPQMAEAAQAEELKGAFAVHLKETEGQVKRLEQVFQRHRQLAELKAKRLTGTADQKLTATPVTSVQVVKARARDSR